MNKHKILYKLIAMFTIVILLNAININTTKAITMNAYPMTDSNFNIWGDSVQTTFSDKGYFSVLNVNGTEANIKNCSGSLNGVSVQTKLSYISNGNYVKISFEATNTSGSTKTIGIATYADIQIADNDYAPITNLSGNRGFTMTDGTKYTFTFLGRNSYGVTDVDTYWFGQFQLREENKWNNSQTFDYGSESSRKGDSGMAFSWKNRTIQNGEKLIFSVAIGIGTLNTPPTIRVTSQLKNSYYQGEVVDVQGYVNDVDNGDIVTVKYAIDGGEEMVIANNLRPNGSEKYFHRRAERHHVGSPAGNHAAAGTAESGSGNGSATAANRRTGAEAGAFPVLRTPSAGSTGRGHGEDPAAACESGHRVQGADHGAGQSDR